ncbi:MAG: hypothetical protein M3O74_11780 [Pseudomonadota bacterium]|nr:hypothetical protein [Pseudomonadota bacterium]
MSKIALGRLAFAFLICISLYLWTSNQIWSQSVDLAHHYALITRLFDSGTVVVPDASLGEMTFYPRLSHRTAASLGALFGSPIMGMQLAAMGSMIAAWVGICTMLSSFGGQVRIRALLLFAVLLNANRLVFKLDIFGSELVNNYFFSQLFAQAAMICALAVALLLDRARVPVWIRYAFLIVAILVIESAHLLPALELLICMGVLVLSDLIEVWTDKRPAIRKRFYIYAAVSGIALVGTAVAVVVHPTFSAMRMISENNGDLTVHRFSSLTSLVILAVVVVISSVLLLLGWQAAPTAIRRDILPLKYFGSFGLSASLLFMLQCIALHFGQGSEYACKKYGVALATILLIQVALHLVARFSLSTQPFKWLANRRLAAAEIMLPGVIIALAFFSPVPRHPELTVAELHKLEVQTREIAALSAKQVSPLPTIAVHLPTNRPMLDYMYTIAVFKAPRNQMVMHILANRGPSDYSNLYAVVTTKDDATYDDKACRLPWSTADLVAIDAACHRKTERAAAFCRSDFDFTKPGSVSPLMLSGFSAMEESGTWTEGRDASFKCELPPSDAFKPTRVEVVTSAFVSGSRQQHMTVSSNASTTTQAATFKSAGEIQTITLPLTQSNSGWLSLRFSLPDAISPKEVGMSTDDRPLGLSVKAIRFR